MLIDAILDRKADRVEGVFNYNPKEFYDYLMDWDLESYQAVTRAMDEGTNADVQAAMCKYIDIEGYNEHIKDFVNSVDWLTPDPQNPK